MKNIFKINNPEYFLILFFGLSYYIFILYDNHISLKFNYQYFLYDYSFGFIKRGLLGQILNILPISITEQVFVGIATLLIIILGILFVKIIDEINFKNKFLSYFLICLLLISPSLLKNLWYDLGRLDILGILYCLLFLLPFSQKIIHILFILSPIVLFIHEGFLLLWLPTYFICWFIINDMKINKVFLFFCITSIASIFFNIYFGKLEVDFEIFKNYLINKSSGEVYIENTVITDSLYNQIYNSMVLNFTHVKFWFLGFINLFTFIYIIKIFFKILNINKLYYKFIFIPIPFTFIMFFLGSDALRWFSNICFSLYIILIAILAKNKNEIREYKFEGEDFNYLCFMIFILLIMLPFTKLGVLWW
ncbi:hypothetical protein [Apibacter muscae]|uniref:hypothetical protein n=1 Tax=Apibacter muscae TaxID=2509004 RepID=UPI0011B79C01|nr:hypothetical protein [Apibacter muscae]